MEPGFMAEPVPRMRRSTERSEVMFLSADQKAVAAKPGSRVSVAALHAAPRPGHGWSAPPKAKRPACAGLFTHFV